MISQVIPFIYETIFKGLQSSFDQFKIGKVDLEDPVCTTSMLGPGSAGIKG